MIELSAPTHRIEIHLAGDFHTAVQAMRAYCEKGFCVTVERTSVVYTRGMEEGVKIGLVNYPRFPSSPQELRDHADLIATGLIEALHQDSALIITPDLTYFISRRGDRT